MKSISKPLAEMAEHYDVVVIGSGYGGSIAASRMARAGKKVCLLERGREILPGEYPDTELEAATEIQLHAGDKRLGSETAMFDIRVQEQQNVVIGCGLGGTSLINASVSLAPAEEVFEDPAWPEAIRNDSDGLFRGGFDKASQMLKPQLYPSDHPEQNYPELNKHKAHQKSAKVMGASFYSTPINVCFETPKQGVNHVGVEQQACNNCGDCITGCNYSAKNTTLMNYLPDAYNYGADIFCLASVRSLSQTESGWRVFYQEVDAGREVFDAPELFVDADIVIVAAGTLGSNEILLRSKERGLSLSSQLGQRFSGNGDVLGFGYNTDEKIDGIGLGAREPEDQKGKAGVGPCITSVIDLRSQQHKNQKMVIEEGSLPGAMNSLLPAVFATAAGFIGEDTDIGVMDELSEHKRVWESLIRGSYHGAVNHTQTYLVMSHDDAQGKLSLEDDRIKIDWPDVGDQQNFHNVDQRLEQATEALGGTYIKNPVWTPLMNHSLVTVHPLGGCCLADSASEGVVNHKGQVFTGEDENVYEGLYVADGSIIPGSLAVNPLLTISALAERSCALIAKDRGWTINYDLSPIPQRDQNQKALGLSFTETMKGTFNSALNPGVDDDMSFVVTVATENLDQMLQQAEHAAKISGTLECQALSNYPLVIREGVFRLFERIDEFPDTRKMVYQMQLLSREGETFYFDAHKLIKDDVDSIDMWRDTTTLFVSLYQGDSGKGAFWGKAVLHIEPQDFLKQMTTIKVFNAENLAERLKATARFGKFFAGVLYESYGGIFYDPDPAKPKAPRKKRALRAPAPEIYNIRTDDDIGLRLKRFQGGTKGPVMLVHGLGVSSEIFSTDMIDTNLVEYLVAHDYDVWLLDFRVSIALAAASEQSNGDDIAKYDYPAAITKIQQVAGVQEVDAIVHCYGATTFFMSMLAGLKGVRSIVASQVAMDLDVPLATKLKTGLYVPSMLKGLGVETMSARLPTDGGGFGTRLYDRALDLYAMALAQGRCHNDACHRITFMFASLYKHENLNDLLHQHLDELFVQVNMDTFKHLAAMCRKGHLVDKDGQDVYLPKLENLKLPILFLSGEENECYLPAGTKKSYQRLVDEFGGEKYSYQLVPGYGHIDCIFGANADKDVFSHILTHLEQFNL